MRTVLIGLGLVLAAASVTTSARADVIGDTYSIGLSGLSVDAAGNTTGLDVINGTAVVNGLNIETFGSGGEVTNSAGELGDTFELIESSTVTGNQVDIEIVLEARNSIGDLTNLFADGRINPFGFANQGAFLFVGTPTALGGDNLNPLLGTTDTLFTVNSIEVVALFTDGTTSSSLGVTDSSDASGVSFFAGAVSDGLVDISTPFGATGVGGPASAEIAGFQANISVTTSSAVPEPGSAAALFGMLLVVAVRRKRVIG